MTEPEAGQPEGSRDCGQNRLSPEQVEECYRKWSGDLRAFLWGLTRDNHLVDELLQASFAKLVDSGHTARAATLRGWLFRVAHNEAMLARRRQATRERGLRTLAGIVSEPSDAGPSSTAIRNEDVSSIHKALAALPLEQRRVVEQRVYDEKSFAEIAKDSGIPLGTALTRMRLALQKLQRWLDDHREP